MLFIRFLSVVFVMFCMALFNSVLADEKPLENSILENITRSIHTLCQPTSDKGKYFDSRIKANGEAEVTLKVFGLSGKVDEAALSKGEWDGIQQVIKEQQGDDNKNYRECVRHLTPIFMDKFMQQRTENDNVVDDLRKKQASLELQRICDIGKGHAKEKAAGAGVLHSAKNGGLTGAACGFLLAFAAVDMGATFGICTVASGASAFIGLSDVYINTYLDNLDDRCSQEFDGQLYKGRLKTT